MRALSFSQPWAWVVVHGPKRIENRKWRPPSHMIGQRFAIHAAKSWDEDAYQQLLHRVFGETPIGLPLPDAYDRGAVIGTAILDSYVGEDPRHYRQLGIGPPRWNMPEDQRRWFFGPYGWLLRDVRPLRTALPCKGALSFWPLPPDIEAAITNPRDLP